jgi:glycosyltransferase involved in cell wall biosynthesis
MRIAINVRRWVPGQVGGIENYLRAVVGGLAAHGHELTLFVLDAGVDASRELAPGADLRIAPLRAIGRSIKRELNPHAHDVLLCPQLGLDPLESGLPSVAMIPDLAPRLVPDCFDVAYRDDREQEVTATIRAATVVLTLSHYSRETILDAYDIQPERVVVTHCDVGAEFRDPPPTPPAFGALGVPGEYVYFPANFWPHKNHATLLAAFALLVRDRPELRLLLTGAPTPITEAARVRAQIQALGLSDHVRMLGVQPSDVVVALMRQAAVLVFATLFEGFGIPPLEAFHLGTPVVASGVAGNAEVVGDAAMIVDPTDPRSIADGIARVLDDDSLRAELIHRGRARIPKFSWQRTVEIVEAALSDAAAWRVPARLQITLPERVRVSLLTHIYNGVRFLAQSIDNVLRAIRHAASTALHRGNTR